MSMLSLTCMDESELVLILDLEPFVGYFLLQSIIREDPKFPAAAGVYVKEGLPHLMLNPVIFGGFSVLEKVGVLVHEYMHVILEHCTKRCSRVPKMAMTENIAKDIAINQLIIGNWPLPAGAVHHNNAEFNFPADLNAEEYFELLKKKFTPEELNEKFKGFDDHSGWGSEDDGVSSEVIRDMARRYMTNGGNLGKKVFRAGSAAGNMVEEFLVHKEHTVNWRVMTRMFMCSVQDHKRKFTFKRSSRRYGLPFQGQTRTTKNKVMALVDTSGSMSESFLAHIGGELNAMTSIMQIDVVFCDADIHGMIKKYRPTEDLTFPGRGGTDMQPGFELAVKEGYRGVVCFTDGDLYREVSSSIPTLWVVANNTRFEPPFGKVCHVHWKE